MAKISKTILIHKISNGEIIDAIETLLSYLPENHKSYNKFILLIGQLKTLENQINLGLETRKTYLNDFARISKAALEFIGEISDLEFASILEMPKDKLATRIILQEYLHENKENYQYDIFFCFSSQDIDEARIICDQLRGYGLRVFFSADDMRLKGGYKFSEVIDEALENSRHFVLLCTPSAMLSQWVNMEYTTFHDQVYINDKSNRRFLIWEGISFETNLLRIIYRSIQRVKNIEEILNIITPNFKNLESLNTLDKKPESDDQKIQNVEITLNEEILNKLENNIKPSLPVFESAPTTKKRKKKKNKPKEKIIVKPNEDNIDKEKLSKELYSRAVDTKDNYEIIRLCTEILELKPDFVNAYYTRGFGRNEIGQYTQAIKDFDKFIEIRKDVAVAYNNRGWSKLKLGKYADAIKDFDEALKIEPSHTLATLNKKLAQAKKFFS